MEGYDIILQAGQSNADGYGHGPAANPYVPDERILYYTAGTPDAADCHPPEDAVGGAYVETADLRSNDQKTGDGDEIHFCREDLQELGRRYFEAFTRLIQ